MTIAEQSLMVRACLHERSPSCCDSTVLVMLCMLRNLCLHAGSNDSISLALKRLQGAPARLPRAPAAFPLLSHASLGVQPIITPLPSSLEIMPLSSGLIVGALDILPAAFDSQVSARRPGWLSHMHPDL